MFRRFLYSIQRFMAGRNGFDRITKYVMLLYCVLLVVGTLLTNITHNFIVYIVTEVVVYLLIAYTLFRTFSKNIPKRRAECARFDKLLEKLGRKKSTGGWNQPYATYDYNDYNTYKPQKPKKPKSDKYTKYVTCKNCKAVLRLKRRRGVHTAVCPKCGKDVKVISFR